jgi:hypothetical protein
MVEFIFVWLKFLNKFIIVKDIEKWNQFYYDIKIWDFFARARPEEMSRQSGARASRRTGRESSPPG